jgi:hypothetical protein
LQLTEDHCGEPEQTVEGSPAELPCIATGGRPLKSVVPFLGTMTVRYNREAATKAWDPTMKFLATHLTSKGN